MSDYPSEVINAWAPPQTDDYIAEIAANHDNEIRLVAVYNDEIVGIGVLHLASCSLRACYVDPPCASKGIGRHLIKAIEAIARSEGLPYLVLDSSLTAKGFYHHLGYNTVASGEHVLRGGMRMACIKMHKVLVS